MLNFKSIVGNGKSVNTNVSVIKSGNGCTGNVVIVECFFTFAIGNVYLECGSVKCFAVFDRISKTSGSYLGNSKNLNGSCCFYDITVKCVAYLEGLLTCGSGINRADYCKICDSKISGSSVIKGNLSGNTVGNVSSVDLNLLVVAYKSKFANSCGRSNKSNVCGKSTVSNGKSLVSCGSEGKSIKVSGVVGYENLGSACILVNEVNLHIFKRRSSTNCELRNVFYSDFDRSANLNVCGYSLIKVGNVKSLVSCLGGIECACIYGNVSGSAVGVGNAELDSRCIKRSANENFACKTAYDFHRLNAYNGNVVLNFKSIVGNGKSVRSNVGVIKSGNGCAGNVVFTNDVCSVAVNNVNGKRVGIKVLTVEDRSSKSVNGYACYRKNLNGNFCVYGITVFGVAYLEGLISGFIGADCGYYGKICDSNALSTAIVVNNGCLYCGGIVISEYLNCLIILVKSKRYCSGS